MSCCNRAEYNNTFDDQLAKQELGDYLKSGLKKSSLPFMKVLEALPLDNKSVLDIGGGIGALTFELFKKNILKVSHVDLSEPYVKTFRSEVDRRSLTEKVQSYHGDFLDFVNDIETADLVSLDKVICCYPDFDNLVRQSIKKSNVWYAYSIPRTNLTTRIYFFIDKIMNKLKGKNLSVFFHSKDAIERIVIESGFTKLTEKLDGYWRVVLFKKSSVS